MSKNYLHLLLITLILFSCKPEAKWSEDIDTKIDIDIRMISAGYIECNFTTNKDAYYMISIEYVREGYDPMAHQKQFMTLALDSANVVYLAWRNQLLLNGEINIAPFSSHSLQYGTTKHFFTGLQPDRDYWLFAFVVNPETMTPMGRLHLETIRTTEESVVDIHFEYRVKDNWDYIYPVNSVGIIHSDFPYIATTRDSLEIHTDDYQSVQNYFLNWMSEQFLNSKQAKVFYGVQVTENNGENSHLIFEDGHTYYTAICGFDGTFKQSAIYKFKWYKEDTDYFFVETDSANIINEQ